MTNQKYEFKRRGMLIVVSAPSGGGKSIVLQRLLAQDPCLTYSVSVTSRPPRAHEVDGKDYHFVTREQFQQLVRDDVFYEYAEVHGNMYGTREDTVQLALEKGLDVVLDVDVRGGLSVKWRSPDAVLIFLMPPSDPVLEQRLRTRASDSEEQIQLRLKNAQEEITHWRLYDYVIVNEDLDQTVSRVQGILQTEGLRVKRLKLETDSL